MNNSDCNPFGRLHVSVLTVPDSPRGDVVSQSLIQRKIPHSIVTVPKGLHLINKIKELGLPNLSPYLFHTFTQMQVGEIGVNLGHFAVYHDFLRTKKEVCLLFEDDAVISPEFYDIIPTLVFNDFGDLCFLSSDTDWRFKAGYYTTNPTGYKKNGFEIHEINHSLFKTQSVIFNRKYASGRLGCAFPILKPIDHYEYLGMKTRFSVMLPSPVLEDEIKSIADPSSNRSSGKSFKHLIRNYLFKYRKYWESLFEMYLLLLRKCYRWTSVDTEAALDLIIDLTKIRKIN